MLSLRNLLLIALFLTPSCIAQNHGDVASLTKQIQGLRSVPDAQRPSTAIQIATDIRTLPPGLPKLKLAYGLSHLVTEGDPGREALQTVATTLTLSLAETPQPAKNNVPPGPYFELAELARYEGITVDLNDPLIAQATQILTAHDADIEKSDFTLKDLHGKKVTFSELRGKVVLVNFWATWCPPCRKEMPDLDAIYTHFQSQGLVVLSLSDEDALKVNNFINQASYHPVVLLDTGGSVAKQFHIEGIPKSFVFDRQGKLVAQSIDMRTQRQFLAMLAKAGLHL